MSDPDLFDEVINLADEAATVIKQNIKQDTQEVVSAGLTRTGLHHLLNEKLKLDAYLTPWEDKRTLADTFPRGKKQGHMRRISQVTGIVLHSTGRHDMRTAEGRDIPAKRRPKKTKWQPGWSEQLNANFYIMKDGVIYYNHDVEERRPSSGLLNRTTVAVEFIGNFRMTNGNWQRGGRHAGHHDTPTKEQIKAGRRLITYLKVVYQITHVYAHLHSHESKGCPGRDIWAGVGEWALANGLTVGDYKPSGRKIPEIWRDQADVPKGL